MTDNLTPDKNCHRPPHLYLDGEIYFVASRTRGRVNYFTGERKIILEKCLISAIKKYQIKLYSWAILDNHYHLLFGFSDQPSWNDELSSPEPLAEVDEIRYAGCRNKFPPPRRGQFVRPIHSPLSRLVQYVNRSSATLVNKIDNKPGRKIWYQYWDTIVKDENDFYTHFNYIHYNPIKHGLVSNRFGLLNYNFCSYHSWYKKIGSSSMDEIIGSHHLIADCSKWDI